MVAKPGEVMPQFAQNQLPILSTDEGRQKAQSVFNALAGNQRFKTACALAGIKHKTAEEWVRRGRQGEEPYEWFYGECVKAMAVAEGQIVQQLTKDAQRGDRDARKMLLERRYRSLDEGFESSWGASEKQELDVNQTVRIKIEWPSGPVDPGKLLPATQPPELEDPNIIDGEVIEDAAAG